MFANVCEPHELKFRSTFEPDPIPRPGIWRIRSFRICKMMLHFDPRHYSGNLPAERTNLDLAKQTWLFSRDQAGISSNPAQLLHWKCFFWHLHRTDCCCEELSTVINQRVSLKIWATPLFREHARVFKDYFGERAVSSWPGLEEPHIYKLSAGEQENTWQLIPLVFGC